MDGLRVITKLGPLDVIGPVLAHFDRHQWICARSYDPFLWPGGHEYAPPAFRDNVKRIDANLCAFALGTAALQEFAGMMCYDWMRLYALPPEVNASEWWTRATSWRKERNVYPYPDAASVEETVDLFAENSDGAFWDVFCKDESLLSFLSSGWPGAVAVRHEAG